MSNAAERFIICGAGGHGKVIADLVRSLGHGVVGYVDRDRGKLGRVVEPGGAKVIAVQGETDAREALSEALAVIAVGHNAARLAWLLEVGPVRCPALVHPSAVVSPSAEIGEGTVVFPRAVVNAATSIGRGVILNSGAIVEHDCRVGDAVHVSPGATVCGGVTIGAESWVGAGSVVIPGVAVGARAVVGAGAVVIRDVPDDAKVVGNPGRVLAPARG